ncbi:MAG: ABC transporter ATP-binding protein [Halobacteriales archaeon]|nr:ABC transporter ATP-binding protein [Halobacteriales archaeon]
MSEPQAYVDLQNLHKHFPIREGLLKRQVGSVKAVRGVDLDIKKGESLGIVGESGCGKTTLGKTVMRLLEPTSGSIYFDGEDLAEIGDDRLKHFRRRIQMVFQDPDSSLNPRRTVQKTLMEPLKIHDQTENADEKINQMLERMDLKPATYRSRFPHELSGGQKQRIGVARALMLEPEFLVLDEPTSALDVSVQARILELLNELKDELNLTFMFISHDLSVINYICDRVAVMYLGEVVEQGPTEEVFSDPKHPYTEALFSAIYPIGEEQDPDDVVELRGEPPSPIDPPSGCSFHPRCHRQEEIGDRCKTEKPPIAVRPDSDGRQVACHLYEDPDTAAAGLSDSEAAGAGTAEGSGTD